ncbi:MAG TPA: FAD-dependent oxidoreductase, partial [Anseongella sp.]|nr:FAD-dependent oxidoreductase [Anseongella sp.]
ALGLEVSGEQCPAGLVYDMKEPYHYFRTHKVNGKNYLIVGGEDHKTGEAGTDAFSRLEAYVKTRFNVRSIDFKWSSQYYEPADGLPYIGRLPGSSEALYVATGFSGNGMTFGSLAGRILADMIVKGNSPYQELFNPSRIKPVAGFKNFIKENTNVIKHFIADRIAPVELENLAELNPGEAMIINYKSRKLAVYKNPQGEVFALDPVCPHAKCFVQWNSAEASWDCPCHGSRFSPEGEVLTGPAHSGLDRLV